MLEKKRDEHFTNIKDMYNLFYKFLLVKHGMYPIKDTKIGYWGVSVADEVYDLFKKMELNKYSHLLDLGSGDGKVVLLASLFTNATGIEFDPWLIDVSNDVKNKLFHIPSMNNVSFIKKDFLEYDFSKFDVIFLHPDGKNPKLDEKLSNEFNGKLIVYGPHNHPESLEKESTLDINGTLVTFYSSNPFNN